MCKYKDSLWLKNYLYLKKQKSKNNKTEALLQYSTGEDKEKVINATRGITAIDSYSDIGVGFGGGCKWTTPNGFIVETNVTLGRNFKLDDNSPDFFFNWGINLGYRFF